MNSRAFTKRIKIYQTTEVDDGFGGITNGEDILVLDTWAKIENVKSLPQFQGLGLDFTSENINITIRKRNDKPIDSTTMYVMYRDSKYSIVNEPINVNYDNVYVMFTATKDRPKTFTNYAS